MWFRRSCQYIIRILRNRFLHFGARLSFHIPNFGFLVLFEWVCGCLILYCYLDERSNGHWFWLRTLGYGFGLTLSLPSHFEYHFLQILMTARANQGLALYHHHTMVTISLLIFRGFIAVSDISVDHVPSCNIQISKFADLRELTWCAILQIVCISFL